MRILLTGAAGFLGWHTRVRLRSLTEHEVVLVTRENWSDLADLAADVDAIIHVAGINRGAPHEVEDGNIELAEHIATALKANSSVQRVIFANSIWAGTGSPYGSGKARANSTLAEAAAEAGATYVDVRLPNLFGEGGRANYNSFVATFVHKVVAGDTPEILDRPIRLLHVQAAAQTLIDALTTSLPNLEPVGTETSVQTIYDTLVRMKALYNVGDIPPLLNELDIELFNTLRWAMFPHHYPITLTKHADQRGDLVETVKAHGGQGQTFVSTTHPCITRGEHFHLEKVERFVVIRGRARISLRKVFTDEVISFDVNGDEPAIVDMPTMWVHNITNTGDDELVTLFWAHELFNPERPDTFWEPVALEPTA
ncbi:NAD-dependent epimerase/dehydratase family protein [Leekyejoonella antrihumi]|uniref:SDR family oxidoreductase n=1 Tax=Leekyejoonella antrihumi TaxID=1660198 RepID=A0A563E152_9MICO|nr:NAD-dependent epimerase/dehydratase family protein [Leekyejoonella antrihumi]TWP35902.1 SDR family oxidoreductase [Leekyejoonella antrihumi]